ncbi:palmitoyl acyltransferase 12 [Trypanosoma cruzi cruzi]|uniref:Palmitoyltransferase n=1 Tax=Trypanosoma cruzi TaxID=5693 RepID=A0A2V2UJA1_TRYCR|nr:palmitoyl acyltransferase 12 [Trypanosoma cruzi cruzi]PBJ79725.1 palmitoyl acyltransferase 12 [Trypanosoma cruzi cruzi]PWU84051.1 putative palmitoyl acyltransferase 12 [Trypanosoma cruzi]
MDCVVGMRNVHSHTSRNCGEVCCLCLSYTFPFILFLIIVSSTVGFDAYFITLCLRYNRDWRTAVSVLFMVVGTAGVAMLMWAFIGVLTTAAGYVPSLPWKYPPTYVGEMAGFRPPTQPNSEGFNPYCVTQLDRTKRLRYCVPCAQYKPDNAYHCNFCSRCTYQFDHHCPAVNNCIGRENYKIFVTFLIYAGLVSFLNTVLMLIGLLVLDGGERFVLWFGLPLFMGLLGSSVFFFGMLHVCWSYRGESTMSRHVALFNLEEPMAQDRQQADEKRRAHWDAVLGTDRRWWRMLLPMRARWLNTEALV